MITRRYPSQQPKSYPLGIRHSFKWLGLFSLAVVICFGAIALNRFNCTIAFPFSAAIAEWHPAISDYFQVPSQNSGWILCGVLLLVTQVITRISPQPKVWSRVLVVSLLLSLILRYVLWRLLTTLNFSSLANGLTSLVLVSLEMLMIAGYSVQLFLMVRERDRRREADQYAVAVAEGRFLPSVDVLIPTYNESSVILRRTVIGCQAMSYVNKQVFLLDDGDREEIRKLAAELGCHYIARPTHHHAKAGNLNYAIARTHGDLITVFDADFIPTKDFLTRTVGFFQNPKMGMVQTHQCFYNPDPMACNLGIEQAIPHETETFTRHYQRVRDGAESTLCYGSSFVVRRDVLLEAGGFVTRSVSEDLYTGIRISALGYQIAYLDENLSAGLVAEDMPSHILQRQRWGRGSIQAFFMKENPFTIPGLTWRQRLAYMEGVLQWFSSPARFVLMLLPGFVILFKVFPFSFTAREWIYYFLPLYLVQISTMSWLNHRASAALAQEVYSLATCFPVALTVVDTLFRPFNKGFKVTPKGCNSTGVIFQWRIALPLLVLSGLTGLSFLWQGYQLLNPSAVLNTQMHEFFKLGLIWNGYNLIVLAVVIFGLFDIPKSSLYPSLRHSYPVRVKVGDRWIEGTTNWISEIKAEVSLNLEKIPDLLLPGDPVGLDIPLEGLFLNARVIDLKSASTSTALQLAFERVSLEQHRKLVEALFCTPGQWKRQSAPGELRMLGLLLGSLFRPQVLFRTRKKVLALAVAQN